MNKNSKFYKAFDEITTPDKVVENILNHKTKKTKEFHIIKMPAAVICACVVLSVGTIAAAAESEEFNQFIYTTTGFVINPDKVVYATPIPQKPIDGFTVIEDMGESIPEGTIKQEVATDLWSVPFKETAENKYTIEKIAYENADTIVTRDGFQLEKNQSVKISIDADFSAEYHTDQNGEYVAVGYIYDDVAYDIFSGKTDGESLFVDFIPEKSGEYRFYIINCSAGMQNFDSVTVEITDICSDTEAMAD